MMFANALRLSYKRSLSNLPQVAGRVTRRGQQTVNELPWNNRGQEDHRTFLVPQRNFSEANVESDSFFSMKKFKSMFGGSSSKDAEESEKDGKKQTVMGGFREGFATKMEEKRVKQENEQFHFFYDELVQVEAFDSLSYLSVMKKLMKKGGAEGIRGKIASATGVGKKELELFKANVQILEQFKQKELSEIGYLNIMSKRRVMKETGQSLDRINQVCKNYFEIKMLHAWVRKHHENGGDRPDSMQEAHRLIKKDGDMDTHLAMAWGGAHGKKKMMKKARKRYLRSMNV